ncbi:MAG: four helix bundle protein [Phycisphaerales bacterium]|nr:MAG: four helix bundle protein [Phycisphaerales bacterium]
MHHRIDSFRDLIVWQKAMDLADLVYIEVKHLPSDELFGLVSRLRRASVSIPSNIAEGWGRGRSSDFLRYLRISRGSLFEVATQAELCSRAGYRGNWDRVLQQSEELSRILYGLMKSVERDLR